LQDLVETEHFRILVAVADAGSLSRAASDLGLSQPYLSRVLTRLESQWGEKLFRRTGRGVVPTDFGAMVLPKVRGWLQDTQSLVDSFRTASGTPLGTVRIGCLPSMSRLMSALYMRLKTAAPGIRLQFREGYVAQVEAWLESGAVDLGVTMRYDDRSEFDDVALARFDCYLCGPVGDPLTANGTIEFKDLGGIPVIVAPHPGRLRRRLEDACSELGTSLNTVLEAESINIQREVAAAGGAYAFLSHNAIEADVKAGRLQACRIVNPPIVQHLSLALSRQGPTSRATREVSRQLQVLIAEPRGPA
jgi:LysR family nitrogen assimilation transcriptional regulator